MFYILIQKIMYRHLDIAEVELLNTLDRRVSSDETSMLFMTASCIGRIGLVLLGKRVCVNS